MSEDGTPRDAADDPAADIMTSAKPLPPKPPGGIRPSDAEVERLVNLVDALLEEATSRTKIAAMLKLPQRTADEYIRRAKERRIAEWEKDRKMRKAYQNARLHKLRKKMLDARQYKNALAAEHEIAALHGDHAPRELELSGKNGLPIETVTRVVLKLPDNGARPDSMPLPESPRRLIEAAVLSEVGDGDSDS